MRKILISFLLLFITTTAFAERFTFCNEESDCVAGCYGNENLFGRVTDCQSCDEGTYTSSAGQTKCADCKYVDEESRTLEDCPEGRESWYNGGKGCIVNLTPTTPGTSEYGCNATITCGPGRYWGGKEYGCVKCPEMSIVVPNTYNANETYRPINVCKRCDISSNKEQTSCQYAVQVTINGEYTHYDLFKGFTMPQQSDVIKGSYFTGWKIMHLWCDNDTMSCRSDQIPQDTVFQPGNYVTNPEVIAYEREYTLTPDETPCPKGWYCPGGTSGKKQCTNGLTTYDIGAESANDCGIDYTVEFKDSKGTFHLPKGIPFIKNWSN